MAMAPALPRPVHRRVQYASNPPTRETAVPPIFSIEARTFPGQRWANILLRSLHLVAVAGLGAGFIQGAPDSQWLPFWYIALGSGLALMLLYLWSSIAWLVQAKGLVILVKLLLLGAAGLFPQWRAELFITVIVLSSVIAHAPGSVRGFGWRPGSSGRKECDGTGSS